jgi:hypothetical protein
VWRFFLADRVEAAISEERMRNRAFVGVAGVRADMRYTGGPTVERVRHCKPEVRSAGFGRAALVVPVNPVSGAVML